MKRLFFVIIVIYTTSDIAFPQNYRITDFVADSLSTWQVKLSFSGRGSTNDDKETIQEKNEDENKENSKISGNVYYLNSNAAYSYLRLRPKREIQFNSTIGYNHSSSNYKSDWKKIYEENEDLGMDYSNDTENINYQPSIDLRLFYTEYIREKLGLSLSGRLTLLNQYRKMRTDYTDYGTYYNKIINKRRERDTDLLFSIIPQISYGRVYDGDYAAKAFEILTELKKVNGLKRDLSVDEFKTLSQIVLERMGRYHYDTRIKNMEALYEIAEYLKSIDALKTEDSLPLIALQDIYIYKITSNRRYFGTMYYLNFSYSDGKNDANTNTDNNKYIYYYHYNEQNNALIDSLKYSSSTYSRISNTDYTNRYSIKLGLSYNRIINWNWWYSLSLYSSYNVYPKTSDYRHFYVSTYSDTTDKDYTTKYRNYSFFKDINGTLNYQWNSRSVSSISVILSHINVWSKLKDKSYSKYDDNHQILRLSLDPRFRYFFTPKLMLDLIMSFSVDKTITDIDKTFSPSDKSVDQHSDYLRIYSYFSISISAYL